MLSLVPGALRNHKPQALFASCWLNLTERSSWPTGHFCGSCEATAQAQENCAQRPVAAN